GLAQELGSVPCRYQRTGGILHPLETRAFPWRTPNPLYFDKNKGVWGIAPVVFGRKPNASAPK
ncbi:MAG: hypothetical protein P4M00_03190, partial [Azospirillaceae bacterium]|nr:hypothetical protein [Azospirillaceae bacterium]